MINIFIAFIFIIICANFFYISYQVNGVNRAVVGTPISLFEASVPLYENKLYFDKVKLENSLTSYYDESLKNYTDKYTVDFYYYNSSKNSICVSSTCDAIKVTVSAYLNFNYKIDRSMSYEIVRNLWIA